MSRGKVEAWLAFDRLLVKQGAYTNTKFTCGQTSGPKPLGHQSISRRTMHRKLHEFGLEEF